MNRYDYIGLFFSCLGMLGLCGTLAAGVSDRPREALETFTVSLIIAVVSALVCRWCEPRGTLCK